MRRPTRNEIDQMKMLRKGRREEKQQNVSCEGWKVFFFFFLGSSPKFPKRGQITYQIAEIAFGVVTWLTMHPLHVIIAFAKGLTSHWGDVGTLGVFLLYLASYSDVSLGCDV